MPKNDISEDNLFLQKLREEELALEKDTKKTKSSVEDGRKKRSTKYMLAMFATTFLTFLATLSLLIFTMTVGGAGNPVLRFFGQNEDTVKSFLLRLTNGTFGFLSVLLLVIIAGTLFYGFSRKKGEGQKRSIAFGFTIVSLGLQFVTILAWLGMFHFVSQLQVQAAQLNSEIQMVLEDGTVLTPPIDEKDTKDLEVPTNIRFTLDNVLQEFTRRGKTLDYVEWDFDNNGTYSSRTKKTDVLFRLNRIGTITINARLTATNGTEMIKTISFIVPQGTFLASPDSGPIPLDVSFDASIIKTPNGNRIVSYEWDFDGDYNVDEVTTSPVITHRFTKVGTYTIRLNAVHHDGTISLFSKKITTSPAVPNVIQGKVKSSIPFTNESERKIELFLNQKVTLDASDFFSNKGKIVRYEWHFSRLSNMKTGKTIDISFGKEGTVLCTLKLWDEEGNTKEETITFVVKKIPAKPKAKFTSTPKAGTSVFSPARIIVGTEVQFDASSSEGGKGERITEYEWDFDGDDIVDATGKEVTHVYDALGKQKVTLTVWNSAKEKEKVSQFFDVRGQDLTAVITANPENPRVPCVVSLDGSLSSCTDCKILGYEWDFGDGKTSPLTGAQVQHEYNEVGVFPVTLTVHTEKETAKTTKNIFCRETAVRACFTATKLTGSSPLKTTFTPECSTGTIVSWKWDFGDGTQSSEQIPTHLFTTPGTYSVSLRVTDNSGNIDTYTLDVIAQ